jgi:Protein of unknown function (DUF3108)
MRYLTAFSAVALAVFGSGAAQAESARYAIHVAGLSIGTATMNVAQNEGGYSFELTGTYGFLVYNGSFSATSKGKIAKGTVLPASFSQTLNSDEKEVTQVSFKAGKVASAKVTPPPGPSQTKDRIPLAPEHLANVLDPVSAILAVSLQAGRSLDDICSSDVAVFTGMVRAGIQFSPDRDTPKQRICKVKFTPVAGHRPTNNVKRIAKSNELRIGFSRELNGDLRFPYSISLPLRVGRLTLTRIE